MRCCSLGSCWLFGNSPIHSLLRLAGSTTRIGTLLCLLVAGVLVQEAAAHPAPFSYLDLRLDPGNASGALVIHDFDAAYELEIDDPQTLLTTSVAREHADALVGIIDSRLRITADGRPAAVRWHPVEVLPERESLRFGFTVELAGDPARVGIETVLFPYDETHQTFINVYEAGRLERQAVLSAREDRFEYYLRSGQDGWEVVRTFTVLGIEHVIAGPDHLLFLLGLLLLGGSFWRLATIVTAFTIGHSVTLSLAALDLVRLPATLVEPAIALSIVVVGVDNLLVRGRQTTETPGAAARDLRPWLAAAFGLIHGFGFAAVLLEIGLPPAALGWSLAAFNVGVELGQLAVVAVAILLLAAVRRYDVVLAERLFVVCSVGVIGAGLYWFVQRLGLIA